MCGFNGVQRGNYFGGKPIRRTEVEVKVGKLKNGKAAGKDEVTGDIEKSEVDLWWTRLGGYAIQTLKWCSK